MPPVAGALSSARGLEGPAGGFIGPCRCPLDGWHRRVVPAQSDSFGSSGAGRSLRRRRSLGMTISVMQPRLVSRSQALLARDGESSSDDNRFGPESAKGLTHRKGWFWGTTPSGVSAWTTSSSGCAIAMCQARALPPEGCVLSRQAKRKTRPHRRRGGAQLPAAASPASCSRPSA